MRRRHLLGAALAIAVAGMSGNAMAQSEIKIGEINSYSLLPAFTEPYRKGGQLAVEEVNAAGGINGKTAVAVFKKLMSEKRPDIQWVDEQWPPQGKIDAGPVVQAVAAANPEAILNVTFGADLVKLVREGNTRGLFKGRSVVSFLTGEPEYLDPLKEETPEGWIVTGYPWYDIKTPDHDKFLKAYQAKYNDYPRLGSIVGYQTIKAAAAILAKANSTDLEKLIAATEGLSMPSPFGEITFRKIDHQSTLGAYVGKTALKDGKGVMVESVYRKGADYLPSDAEIGKLRPKE